jgi:hypothetical protein
MFVVITLVFAVSTSESRLRQILRCQMQRVSLRCAQRASDSAIRHDHTFMTIIHDKEIVVSRVRMVGHVRVVSSSCYVFNELCSVQQHDS